MNKRHQRIVIKKGKASKRDDVFKAKEKFHKEQANLPFEKKIKILAELQKIAKGIKGEGIVGWDITK